MPKYRFVLDYRSDAGSWSAGDEAEFADDFAAWLNRDVRGCLVPADEPEPAPEPEPRALDEPPADRQVKRPARKRGAA